MSDKDEYFESYIIDNCVMYFKWPQPNENSLLQSYDGETTKSIRHNSSSQLFSIQFQPIQCSKGRQAIYPCA